MPILFVILAKAVIGGALVVAFALLAEPIKPKTLAGIFGAAPSIATASLLITILTEGPTKASAYADGMVLGAVAMLVYAVTVSCWTDRLGSLAAATLSVGAWLTTALVLYLVA